MTKFLLRLTLCTAALAAVTTTVANAADFEPPPPPEESWTGPYIGAFVAGVSVESSYTGEPICIDPGLCGPLDPDMSGWGWGGGVLAGFNYQVMDNIVIGVEGDWAWFGNIAENEDPVEATELDFDDVATLRARAGFLSDDTLFYVTGGAAFVKATFGGLVGDPAGQRPFIDDSNWITGWTVGGGIEHAFSEYFHARLEYLYIDLPNEDFDLSTGIPANPGGNVNVDFENVHMIRAGVTLNFGNFF